ncbi:MAG: potassium channel family protein [Leptolyngbya sp. SIO3F4]|nr:potassium channel family protein [Leptolyngbya sp. SIO3F4]
MAHLDIKQQKNLSARIADVSRRLNKITPSDYPVWLIEKTMSDLEAQRHVLLTQLEGMASQIDDSLALGDIEAIADIQAQSRKLKRQDQALEEEFQRLFNVRQSTILKERVTKKLGGSRKRQIKENVITLLVIVVLGLMIYENVNPDLPDATLENFFWIDAGCCACFMANFFFDLSQADSKQWFWKRYFIDFITSIPVPQARTLRLFRGMRIIRLLRFARFLRFLRLLRVLLFFWRGFDHLSTMFNVRLMRKSLTYVCLSLVAGAIAFQFFESSGSDMDETTMVTSLWWSFTTVVTGGFADIHNPETMAGKILTVVLVILGMVLVGIFTATLTTVMVGDEDDIEELRVEMSENFSQLLQRVEQIECHLRSTNSSPDNSNQ